MCRFKQNAELKLNSSNHRFSSFLPGSNFQINVYDEYVLIGNSAVFKCHIPNYMRDHLAVTSWVQDNGRTIESVNFPKQGTN